MFRSFLLLNSGFDGLLKIGAVPIFNNPSNPKFTFDNIIRHTALAHRF